MKILVVLSCFLPLIILFIIGAMADDIFHRRKYERAEKILAKAIKRRSLEIAKQNEMKDNDLDETEW